MNQTVQNKPIDREQLVRRHAIDCNDAQKVIPLGNGEFCFSCDITGLQTFCGNTMSHWAWHSFPLPDGLSAADIPDTGCFMHSRLEGEGRDSIPPGKELLAASMFDNPHTFHLGRIRFIKGKSDPGGDESLSLDEISSVARHCDIWNGLLTSQFKMNGTDVTVTVCVHPQEDAVAVKVRSDLFLKDQLRICFDFPYPAKMNRGKWENDFSNEKAHTTSIEMHPGKRQCHLARKMDDTRYGCLLQWTAGTVEQTGAHSLALSIYGETETEFVYDFFKHGGNQQSLDPFEETRIKSEQSWRRFWKTGGAIELSGSSDDRWFELERRIVLSQYLLAVQANGSLPCAEAGLMNCDPWSGQFHMEMMWWHIAHYALWGRMHMADRQLSCYQTFLPIAQKLASQLGYGGAKWGKMVGPEGRTAPWKGNLALLWKQPHPIFFAELEYTVHPSNQTLEKWSQIVFETAEHMADYAVLGEDGFYHLAPVMPPSELGFTYDGVFDLAYWKWGLDTAQGWRVRMGLERAIQWDAVARNLAPLPVMDGVYIRSPEWIHTYETQNYEHPDMVGVYGMLPPTDTVSLEVARATLRKVWDKWDKNHMWGWDFPWIAMCASRTDEAEIAIEAMLSDTIDAIGASGRGSYPYLPANGGILFAAAMMAVGRSGEQGPGFPKDKGWNVRSENIVGW